MKRDVLVRIGAAWKTHGFALPGLAARKLLSPWLNIEKLLIYRQDPGRAEGLPASASPVLVVRIPDSSSSLFHTLCARFPGRNFPARFAEGGRTCYVALLNGEIVGYAWLASGQLYIDEVARLYALGSGELFIYDCFVSDQFRGRGIYPRMLGALLEDGDKGGARTALIAASAFNKPSIRGIRKAGFVQCGSILYVKWRGKEYWRGLQSKLRARAG